MKVERFLKSFFCFLFSSCLILNSILTASVFAEVKLPTGREDEFGENNIVFYNPNGQRNPCTHQGIGGTLDGNGQIEKIWNYITNLNIDGLSNNPAAISGIIANMKQESNFNPFATNSGGCRGLIQWCFFKDGYNPEFKEIMKDYDQYFNPANNYDLSKIDPKIVDEALLLELDILFKIKPKGTANISSFIDHLKSPSETTGVAGARAYAELFVVLVGRGVYGQDDIEDPAVKNISIKLNGHVEKYQEAAKRRQYAEEIYKTYTPKAGGNNLVDTTNGIDQSSDANKNKDDKKEDNNKKKDKKKEDKKKKDKADENSDATTQSENTTPANTGVIWGNDGFISGGLPGYKKEVPSGDWSNETENRAYTTNNKKPNKILLHSTEGSTPGLAAYPDNNHFAAHFTLDAVNKTINQHYSINVSSNAVKTVDTDGPIQIELVGFSVPRGDVSQKFILKNWGDSEWDYIALILASISEKTGIPLNTNVDWDTKNDIRLKSVESFRNTVGIVGHMHAFDNDHSDPGNIWSQLSAAIARNPVASQFQNGQTYIDDGCLENTNNNGGGNVDIGQLVDGGFKTVDEARKGVMNEYRSIKYRSYGESKEGDAYLSKYHIPRVNCKVSALENCVSFSKWFINRFTNKEVTAIGDGGQVVSNLINNYGFSNGKTEPRPYAIFSTRDGGFGHTGVVLGVDKARNKIIIGEAGCFADFNFTDAKEESLSKFTNGSYTYAYTDVNF
jgi:CHAP domain